MTNGGPGWRAIGLSVLIHAAVLVPMVLFARPPEPVTFETYRVHLVSPPPAAVEEPEAEPAAAQAQPDPQPEQQPEEPTPDPEPEAPPQPEVEREPEPEPDRERPETERPATPSEPEQPTETTPRSEPEAEEATVGGEGLNISTEGREFPYPDYLANVLLQVRRYFRWDDNTRPRGVVYFEILRDGTVRNIRMVRSSGNNRFDFAVQGAVESAGNRRAFGPLPEGFVAPTLPVQLEVEPPR